ncbi:hypothetical protein ACHAWF_001938 [Thalassiosira exigua]
MLNQQSPVALISGGQYVGSGKELRLEDVFPASFPFGHDGPKSKRPTNISELQCLKHYLQLSMHQFMRGDFILVVQHMYNRIKSYQSGIIMCRSIRMNGKPFGEVISTLTEDQIQNAAKNLDSGVQDHSAAGTFLRKSEASCKSVAYTAAAAKEARRKMYALCDLFGIPSIFFTITLQLEKSLNLG